MESSEEKVEMIKKAIAKVMEDEEINGDEDTGRRRRQLLNKLLCELEEDIGREEEIMKELKKVKRQNSITHYLLTAMIVITLGWQFSEVSLILNIKHRFTNPFKSATEMLKGFLKGRGAGAAMKDVQKQLIQPAIPTFAFDTTTTDEDDHDIMTSLSNYNN